MSGSGNDQVDPLSEIKAFLTYLKSTAKNQKKSSDAIVVRFNKWEGLVSSWLSSLSALQTELKSLVNTISDPQDPRTNVNSSVDSIFRRSTQQSSQQDIWVHLWLRIRTLVGSSHNCHYAVDHRIWSDFWLDFRIYDEYIELASATVHTPDQEGFVVSSWSKKFVSTQNGVLLRGRAANSKFGKAKFGIHMNSWGTRYYEIWDIVEVNR